MKIKVHFEYEPISIAEIIRDYHLETLGIRNTIQTTNTASIIQSLYFYHDMIVHGNLEPTLLGNTYRIFIILSFSVIESLVTMTGYKLQNLLFDCERNPNHPQCTVQRSPMTAFSAADLFLQKMGLLDFEPEARAFYDDFRQTRNDVHIVKSRHLIQNNPKYTKAYCVTAMNFLQQLVTVLYENTVEFAKKNNLQLS